MLFFVSMVNYFATKHNVPQIGFTILVITYLLFLALKKDNKDYNFVKTYFPIVLILFGLFFWIIPTQFNAFEGFIWIYSMIVSWVI